MIVKVCGLTQASDAELASSCGADVLGFITGVPESPRSNELDKLAQLIQTPCDSQKAILTRQAPLQLLRELMELEGFDIFHFCGTETRDIWLECKERCPEKQIWQTIGVPIDDPKDESWKYRLDECWNDDSCEQVVLDSAKGGKAGGTGQRFPFQQVLDHLGQESQHLIIAGGLNPENLEETLNTAPWKGLDVSSGIEQAPGQKDHEKVKAFMATAKNWREG